MLEQNTILLVLGGLFLLIIMVAIFMRSRGQALGSNKKLSFKQGIIFIVGFVIIMIFTIYRKAHNI